MRIGGLQTEGQIDTDRRAETVSNPVLDYVCLLSLHVRSSVYLCSFALLLHVPRPPLIVRITPLAHMHQYIGSTVFGLRQPLELSDSGLMTILHGHRARRHQIGGDQIPIRPCIDVHKLLA